MNRPLHLFAILVFSFFISIITIAQDKAHMFSVRNVRVNIGTNDTLVVNGNVEVLSNSDKNDNIHNEGVFIITDSLKNSVDSLFLTSSVPVKDNTGEKADGRPVGKLVFQNNTKNSIYGKPSIYLNNLTVKNGLLTLDTNIVVFGDIELNHGNLNLNKYHIHLYDLDSTIRQKDGKIKQGTETDNYKIYDDSAGYIKALKYYNGQSDPANFGFHISPNLAMGNFFLTRFHNSDTNVTDGGIKKLYLIEPKDKATFGNTKDIQINYFSGDLFGDLVGNDSTLRMFHKEVNDDRYKYLRGDVTIYDDSLKVEGTAFHPGYYTIADSICDNLPRVDLGSDQVVCEGHLIQLRADTVYREDDRPYMTYKWNSPDLNLIDEQNAILNIPVDTINNYLNHTLEIHLEVADTRGCINYDTIRFLTYSNPHFNIVLNKPSPNICMGDTIIFTDTHNNFGNYIWDFRPDNNRDLNDNPSYVFKQSGYNSIDINYTDTNGCVIDTSLSVTVHALPEPVFIVDSESCLGQELVLDNQSDLNTSFVSGAISKYTWDMGNGNQIEITANKVISDSTLLYVSDSITHTGGIPGPDLTYYYNQTGLYDIKLTAETTAGCIYDTSITTQVYDSVYAVFDTSAYTNVCQGSESRFFPLAGTSDTNLVAEYQWHFSDTVITANSLDDTVNYVFATFGLHNVRFVAVSKNGCSNSDTKEVRIHESPVATFTVDPVCLNEHSIFNSFGSAGSNYIWYFEDTTIYSSPGNIVQYVFKNAGKHQVELEVLSANSCAASYIDSAVVTENPEAKFTVFDACMNKQLSDTIIINTSNNINSAYEWDFGDGTTSENEQPVKAYMNEGSYTIRLKASTDYTIDSKTFTCSTIKNKTVQIFDVVPADFKIGVETNVCEGLVSFFEVENISINPDIDYYEWHFQTDTVISVNTYEKYTFSSNGIHNITLKTVTNNGCVDKTSKSVQIYETPIASIISDSVCIGNELAFSIPESDRSVDNIYNWYLEGEHIGTGWYANVNKQFAGTYEFILNIESQNGCINKDTSYAVVHELPIDLFQPQIDVCSDTFRLAGENSDYNYLWNGTLLNNEYIVRNNEICTVEKTDKLTGCKSNETIQVSLNKPLNVELGNDTSVCGNIILDAGYFGSSATYSWSNGEIGRYNNVNSTGEYKVTVYQGGCFASDSILVTVNTQPTLELGEDREVCAFETVNLNAKIAGGDTYLWSNGSSLSSIDITSGNTMSSTYKVTVTDINSCIVTDMIKVTFNPTPQVYLGNDMETCQNESIALNATIANGTYYWNTGEVTAIIYPNKTGSNILSKNYNVRVENSYGCVSRDTISVTFYPIPQVILQDQVACGNELITLDAYVQDAISYNWNNGSIDSILTIDPIIDGDGVYYVTVENQYGCVYTSNQSNVSFKNAPLAILPYEITGCNIIMLDAGNFGANFLWNDNSTTQTRNVYQSGLYTVEITNGNNCTITDSVEATVNYITKPYLGSDLSLCTNKKHVLRTGLHEPEYTFEWNGYSTGDTMLVATSGTYIVRAIHSNGCEDSDTIEVTGQSLPYVDLGPDMYKCTGDNFILDAGTDGFAYYWGSSNGIETNDRLLEVSDTGKFWVQVTNDYGCVATDTIKIKSTSLSIDPLFVTNSKLVAGDSVLFVDMSHPEPLNWLWEFGDLQQSTLQNPVHVYYGGGNYQVILHASNSVCNASIVKIIEVQHRNKSGKEGEELPGEFGDKFIQIQNVQIYPNPSIGNFIIKAELSTRTNAHVYIFDLMGRLISVNKHSNVDNINQEVDIQGKAAGIYIIKIIAGTHHKTYKIIKQ